MTVRTSVLTDPDGQVLAMLGLDERASTGEAPAAAFDAVFERWNWQAIRGCPGRWVLRGERSDLTPSDVIGAPVEPQAFHPAATPDAVLVVPLDDGGLLSFRKPDGVTFVHTLNTPAGLARRLARFGIAVRTPSTRSSSRQ